MNKLIIFNKVNISIVLIWIGLLFLTAEEKKATTLPSFAIYTANIPVYSTVSGNFTFNPNREISKTETYYRNLKQFTKTISGSSYLSIKIDEKVYRFHELEDIRSEWNFENESISIFGKIPLVPIEINMVLKKKTNRDGFFYVTYQATNKTNRIIDIGFRSLLDLSSEVNDNIPLKISTDNSQEREVYSNEFKFTPYKSTYWETYETEFDKGIGIRNYLVENENTPPDQIAFANWDRAFPTEWKYFTNKNINTSSNPSVILWWNPKPIKPGEKREVITEFEIKKKGQSRIYFDLLDADSGSGRLHLKYINSTNSRKELLYFLDSGDNAILALNQDNPLKFILEKNSVLDKIIPISIHGKGNVNLAVKEKFGSAEINHNLSINLAQQNREQSPKFWRSSKYPIIYNSDRDGLKLKGVIRAKDTGKKLGETELVSVKSTENNFVYLGEVDLKEFSGEVMIEIFKQ